MLKKHPRGLAFIFFTEMWERLGFYTLMAILVLYMDKVLGWPDSKKGDTYGIFLALCYFVPLAGGWYAATAAGSYGSGLLGKYYSALAHHEYFLLLTGLLAVSAALVLVFLKRLKRFST